jgi:hypothetical protein
MLRIIALDTPEGRRYAVHLDEVAKAARCSRATAYRFVGQDKPMPPAPERGYVWAHEAAKWVGGRLDRWGSDLPLWVRLHQNVLLPIS